MEFIFAIDNQAGQPHIDEAISDDLRDLMRAVGIVKCGFPAHGKMKVQYRFAL